MLGPFVSMSLSLYLLLMVKTISPNVSCPFLIQSPGYVVFGVGVG